ncbi:ATP-dependent DNA helicase RecG [Aestuariivirga litoralis]|uniref:ATP-dependent DNA helicase RecG n=1 Tax=Aestuariivirga litoralis TaxID=2650924 RepID=UPI0018C626BA|nr:ATP-dependent DNA helicase RecG [Aestuariivirga litoralis]MBG1231644.1 ATP-dependent DNA helicase RecG [Aestuariivirga litoralis]
MRPALLNPLFADVTSAKGIGAKLGKLFGKLLRGDENASTRLIDVLFHLPSHVIDRRFRCTVSQLPTQGIATLKVTVGKHKPPPRGTRLPYKIDVFDDTGHMSLVFFSSFADHLARNFPVGEERYISGEIKWFGTEAQMSHPDYVVRPDELALMPEIEPVYPLTAGLTGKIFHKAVGAALEKLPAMPEWQDAAWLTQNKWQAFNTALDAEHRPAIASVGVANPNRDRLAYDELLANQLALSLVRNQMKRESGRQLSGAGALRAKIIAALPYALTASQVHATDGILKDMASEQRMIRLLQGDVGAGKTVVALLALVAAVESGAQGAFMVPTEILARQHVVSFARLTEGTGLRVAVLTGREKGKARTELLDALAAGQIDILIGTHALFQEDVTYRDLGLVVIDEQHRFGVHQRLALQDKSHLGTDLLVMTATPIPRTLSLTLYGDMDVSKLTEKPAGRLPVDTRVMPLSRMEEIVAGIRRSLGQGVRAYWVCPLVEESEELDLVAAENRFADLNAAFPGQVGLVHGRLKGPEKDKVMADFKSGALTVLVATTVIEVGVDVPEAAIMVIENAERFGLAQLHQLRGRVGRGAAKSTCILLYQEPLGEVAKQRLSIMRDTEDGFRIAEEDLRLRGAGEVLGTAQSGVPMFRIADLSVHGELLAAARDDATLILRRDPQLSSARGEALRHLLYLFERDEAIRLLSSG